MKQKLMIFLQYIVIALIVLSLYSLYGNWTEYVHYVCFGIMGALVLLWLFFYLQGKHKGLLILLVSLLIAPPVFSQSLQDCVGQTGGAMQGCIFETTCTSNQSTLCDWANRLDPKENYSSSDQQSFKEAAGIAGKLTADYDGLEPIYKTHHCASTETTSNDCFCCARILEVKYHTWLVKHGGTGASNVQTVPRILGSQAGKCWPCDIVLIFIVIMEHIIINSAFPLSVLAFKLLAFGFLFWLLLRVMKLTLDLSTAKTLWQDILKMILLVSCVSIILGSVVTKREFKGSIMQGLYMQVVNPVMELIMGLNKAFAEQMTEYGSFWGARTSQINARMERGAAGYSDSYCTGDSRAVAAIESRVTHYFNDARGGFSGSTYLVSDTTDEFGASGRVFSSQLIQEFMCATQRVYNQIAPLTAMGAVIVSSEKDKFANLFHWTHIFESVWDPPSLFKLFYGLLFYIPCVLFGWLIAFEILDLFLRMLFVFPLTPLWLVCAVFKVTRKHAITTCKFLFSLLVDFIAITIGLGVVMAMVRQFMPSGFIENITCWMFDTVRETDATVCHLEEILAMNIFSYSNKYYADHLYRELTKEHSLRIICVVFCMYFLGKRIFFGLRSAFRELLKADVGVDLGGSFFGSAAMDAQRMTRKGVGFTVGLIPGVGAIGTAVVNAGGKMTDSVASAGTKAYNAVANTTAAGINAAGDVTSSTISSGGSALGTMAMAGGKATMSAGGALCGTVILAPVGIAMMALGGAMVVVGGIVKVSAPVVAAAVKLISRVASTAVKASKLVARGVIGGTKRVVKGVGRGVSTATKRLFFLPGKGSDKDKKK